jgi:elongation factor 1-gamma
MKLYAALGSHRGNKILVAAQYAGAQIEPVYLDHQILKETDLLKKNPTGKIPILETETGTLWESNAILRYVGGLNPALGLLGSDNWKQGQVAQWLEWETNELEPPLHQLSVTAYGWLDAASNPHLTRAAGEAIHSLSILDRHLKLNTFLVGTSITIADIAVASLLVNPMKFFFEETHRKQFSSITRWFNTISSQEPFKKVWGKVHLCVKPLLKLVIQDGGHHAHGKEEEKKDAKGKGKPEKVEKGAEKPKAEKAEKPKAEKAPKDAKAEKKGKEAGEKPAADEEDEAPKEVSEKNPLDSLPPSPFNFYDFKTLFVNSPNKKDAVDTFFKQFDPKGYSAYYVEYIKAEGEGKVLYMTNNLMGGLLQKLEHFRKYAFAVHGTYGEEPNLEIRGVWVWRGDGIPFEIKDLDSFEYYKWNRLDLSKEADKKKLEAYWTNLKEGDVVEGLKVQEAKYFK